MSDITTNQDLTNDWDWEHKHVSQSFTTSGETNQFTSVYDIVEAGTVLIAAGPADLSSSASGGTNPVKIVPIGLVETATVALNKPLSRIFEIGSKLSYIIPGRTVGEIALARVLFDGPSLLKMLYSGEIDGDRADGLYKYTKFKSNGRTLRSQLIGSGQIAMNLASSFFDQPIGLCFIFRDQEKNDVSRIYFEGCRVSTYNMGIAANMNVLTESVRMEFIQCTPIVLTSSITPAKNLNAISLADIPIIGDPTGQIGAA